MINQKQITFRQPKPHKVDNTITGVYTRAGAVQTCYYYGITCVNIDCKYIYRLYSENVSRTKRRSIGSAMFILSLYIYIYIYSTPRTFVNRPKSCTTRLHWPYRTAITLSATGKVIITRAVNVSDGVFV